MGQKLLSLTPNIEFKGFLSLLNKEMKNDLPNYFSTQSNQNFADDNVQSVVAFNQQDSLLRMPYGQGRLMGVIEEDITDEELKQLSINFINQVFPFSENP